MGKEPFQELAEKIQQHFAEQTYAEGLSLASEKLPDYPEEFATINYWRICLAARLENFVVANKILESTLASGIWYSDVLLRQSPSLAALQGQEEFEGLAEISQKLRQADGADIPLLVARPQDACLPGEAGCPALFFLHGNMDTAQNNFKPWAHLSTHGWLVITPQSSQGMWTGAYMWADYPNTWKEFEHHYTNVSSQYSLDTTKLVVGGFSMGAEMALTMALNGDFPAKGFVLLGPGGPRMNDLKEWQPLLDRSRTKGLRGVIWIGAADETIPRDNVHKLANMLNAAGIPTHLETFPKLGHAYPPDFEQLAAQAIDFIFSD
jgi:predicted esterase